MIGGVTCLMLPHLSRVLHLHVNRPVYKANRNEHHLFSISESNCIIHWIEICPVDSGIHLFEQLGPDSQTNKVIFHKNSDGI